MIMEQTKVPNHSHAWKGSWNRPMHMDEDEMHPFTVARMTDHNVKGRDEALIRWIHTTMGATHYENEGSE